MTGITVKLRSVEESDAEFTYRIRQNKEKTKFLHAVTGTVENQVEWIRCQRQRQGDYFFLAERLNGEPIGTNAIYNIENNECESGRTLLYGTPMENSEVYLLTLDFVFNCLSIPNVRANIDVENISAIGVFMRFGAEETDRYFHEEMQADYVAMKLTKENFEKNRLAILSMIKRFANRKPGRKGEVE